MEKYNKIRFILGTILTAILFPFLWVPTVGILLICSVLFLLRLSVHFAAALFRPDLIPINNPVDNAFTPCPSNAHPLSISTHVWFLSGRLNVNEFRKHFYTTFLATEELRQKYRNLYCHFVRWGFYCFKKESELNLDERIREQSLISSSDRDIEQFVEEWLNVNDFEDRPNWEILLLHIQKRNSKEAGEKTVLLFKKDHGLWDGVSFVHLIEKLSGVKTPYLVKDERVSSWKKVKLFLTLPILVLNLSLKLLTTSDLKWKNNSPKDPRMFLSLATYNLDTAKKIRRLAKCHFSTILGVIQADALRKFFLKTKRVSGLSELPNHVYLGTAAPWPRHPAMNGEGLGNHLTVGLFKVSLTEEDFAKRLQRGEEEFVHMKESGLLESVFLYIIPLSWPIPHCVLAPLRQLVYDMGIISKHAYYLSPLMMSQEPYQLLGIPVEHIYLPLHIQSIIPLRMITIPVSNGGRLDISVSGRMDIFKNHEEVDYFTKVLMKESLDELLMALESDQGSEMQIQILE